MARYERQDRSNKEWPPRLASLKARKKGSRPAEWLAVLLIAHHAQATSNEDTGCQVVYPPYWRRT